MAKEPCQGTNSHSRRRKYNIMKYDLNKLFCLAHQIPHLTQVPRIRLSINVLVPFLQPKPILNQIPCSTHSNSPSSKLLPF